MCQNCTGGVRKARWRNTLSDRGVVRVLEPQNGGIMVLGTGMMLQCIESVGISRTK